MSLNQITEDVRKPWLNGRFENLKVDSIVGEETDLTLNLSGAITTTCDCKIVKYGNLVNVRLGQFSDMTPPDPNDKDYIYSTNYPTEFIPTNIETISSIVVINNGSNQAGAIDFNDIQPPGSTGIRFQALENNPGKFTNNQNAGIPGPISFSYYLQ